MNEKQKRIYDWLKELDSNLSELYEGATKLTVDKTFPGRERFICHAVREIRNRLPEAVTGEIAIGRLEYAQEIEELAKEFERAGLGGVRVKDEDEQGAEQKIPQEIMVRLNHLFLKHRAVAQRNRENVTKLLIALEPENKSMQSSLRPIVGQWMRETEWFVRRSHEGEKAGVPEEELVERFAKFENTLYALCGYFYEGIDRIEQIIKEANEMANIPGKGEIDQIVSQLVRVRYLTHFFDKLENPHWIAQLKERKFFESPKEPDSGEVYERWPQGRYLKRMATKAPKDVLKVIKTIRSKNPYVRNLCVGCLLEMPDEEVACGVVVIKNIFSSRVREGDLGWAWVGEEAAKLMVKLLEKNQATTFKIAWILLDAWMPIEKEQKYGIADIVSRFSEHDYKTLVLDYYSKVWDVQPEQAVRVLVKILNRCLEDLDKEGKGEKGYDASRFFGYGLQLGDLNEIDMKHPAIKTILVKGICKAGKVLIDKQSERIGALLDVLEGTNRVIFQRIVMYFLRFVKPGTEKERINKFAGNKEYFEKYNPCWNEHRWLLKDKFDDVSDEAKKEFLKWVDEDKYSEDDRNEITERCKNKKEAEPDFEKWENYTKAEELYLVRERFKDEYEQYKKAAGVKNDSALEPRKMVGEPRYVSPMEGTPLSLEAMGKMACDEVIDYILEPKNYKKERKAGEWRDAVDALQSTFKEDVRKRTLEYLMCDMEKLASIPAGFLASLFYGVREGSFGKDGWKPLIELTALVVRKKNKEEEYRDCFHAILNALRVGFNREEDRIEFDEEMAKHFWGIVDTLVHFPMGDRIVFGEERDPMQMSCIQVPGQALELTILLAVVCKKNFGSYWETKLKPEMRKCWKFVLENIREPGVNCMFGIEFARIYWIDGEWVEENLDKIFNEELWDEVWGTYVSWGRPSPECCKFLVKKGIYSHAVERIGAKNKYKFGKEHEEGLVEHLMIGYFNGWINLESGVLKKFFEKASAELRGKAAEFLTTGFKSINEEPVNEKGEKIKEKVAARMRAYWNKRLAAIKSNPKENKKEAIGLAGWLEDSILPAQETLELVEQSLNLSGGEIGEMRVAKSFVEGIRKLGKENELLALRCLKKVAGDKNMHTPWSMIQEPLVKFLEELPKEVWSEGREVADLYGRYNPEKFRRVWEKLNVTKRKEE